MSMSLPQLNSGRNPSHPACPAQDPAGHLATARSYRNLTHYRLRLLLNHSRIHEDHTPTRIRTPRPRSVA